MDLKTIKYEYPSDPKQIKESFEKVSDFLSDLNLSEEDIYNLKLCYTEAFANAIKHANKFNPNLKVEIEVMKNNNHFELILKDQGEGFDYRDVEDCTLEKNLTKYGGRGLFLITQLMDEVKFENKGSCIRMVKRLKD